MSGTNKTRTAGTKRESERRRAAKRSVAKAKRSRDRSRAKLIAQHRTLAATRRRNRARADRAAAEQSEGHGQADVTADDEGPYSTVPPTRSTAAATASPHSTVPRQPQGSDVEASDRLYGRRLHRRSQGKTGTARTDQPAADAAVPEDRRASADRDG